MHTDSDLILSLLNLLATVIMIAAIMLQMERIQHLRSEVGALKKKQQIFENKTPLPGFIQNAIGPLSVKDQATLRARGWHTGPPHLAGVPDELATCVVGIYETPTPNA